MNHPHLTPGHPLSYPARQDLLRFLLVDGPRQYLKREISVSELARRAGVSRNSMSRLLNSPPQQLPMSEQMAIRCYLLVKNLPKAVEDAPFFNLQDWLEVDNFYLRDEKQARIRDILAEFGSKVDRFELISSLKEEEIQ